MKGMGSPVIDNSHLNLDYDNLIFDRGIINGLELSEYNEGESPQITSVKHDRMGFRVVISSDCNDDSVIELEYNIQQLTPGKHETILVPNVFQKDGTKCMHMRNMA